MAIVTTATSRQFEEPANDRNLCASEREHDGAADEGRESQAKQQATIALHVDTEDDEVAQNRPSHDADGQNGPDGRRRWHNQQQ